MSMILFLLLKKCHGNEGEVFLSARKQSLNNVSEERKLHVITHYIFLRWISTKKRSLC